MLTDATIISAGFNHYIAVANIIVTENSKSKDWVVKALIDIDTRKMFFGKISLYNSLLNVGTPP